MKVESSVIPQYITCIVQKKDITVCYLNRSLVSHLAEAYRGRGKYSQTKTTTLHHDISAPLDGLIDLYLVLLSVYPHRLEQQ